MAGTDDPLKQLNTALNYLELLSKQDLTELQKKVYNSFSALAYLVLEGKKADFKDGWAKDILDTSGHPLFTEDEAKTVESISLNVKPLFQKGQEGGDNELALKPFSTKGMIESSGFSGTGVPSMNPDDISLDKTFWKVKDYIAGLDKQTHDLSRELGPYRFFYDMPTDFRVPIPLPFPPYTILVPISPRAIPVLISVFVEAIRLIFSFGPLSSDITRKILSIVVAITDLLQGDWKQGILSLLGYFGTSPLLVGILGKVFLNAFSLIAPDLQEDIILDSYKSVKSLVAGITFWAIATFSPDAIRQTLRLQFDQLKSLVENANGEIQKVEATMQKSVESLGLKIKFHELPADFIPSFDDIQNLQSIARQPSVYCSKEFQGALAPLKAIPPARLILELFNIPTDTQTLQDECKALAGSSIENTMEQGLMPEITVNPDSPLAQISKGPEALKDTLKVPDVPEMPKVPQAPQLPQLPQLPQAPKVPKISNALTKKGGNKKKRTYTKKASRG